MGSSRSRKRLPSSHPDRSVDAIPFSLDRVEHTLAQQRKTCPAIALPFDQFQLRHMPFHHTVIDPPGKASSHRLFVFLNSRGKRLEFGQSAALHLGKPGIEALSGACTKHLYKLLNQVIGPINFWVDLTEFDQRLLLLAPEFFRAPKEEEGSLS